MRERYRIRKQPPERPSGPLFSGFGREKHHCDRLSSLRRSKAALAEMEQDDLLVVSGSFISWVIYAPLFLTFLRRRMEGSSVEAKRITIFTGPFGSGKTEVARKLCFKS